jgi:imidazolonepropionase-like amidohydrolase
MSRSVRTGISALAATAAVACAVATVVTAQQSPTRPGDTQNRQEHFGERDIQPSRATLAIVNGMIIDGHDGQPMNFGVVLIDGNRIVAVGNRDSLKVPAGTKVVDASGMTVMPGLIDVHVHLDIQGDSNYTRWHERFGLTQAKWEETMAVTAKQYVMSGVTSALDLSGLPESLIATRKKIDAGQIPGPRMKLSMGQIVNWGSDLGGFTTAGRDSFSWNVHTPEEARAAALKVINYGADMIKLQNGLTGELVRPIAEEARKRGLRVTGHTGDKFNLIDRVKNGQNNVEHAGWGSQGPDIDAEVLKVLLDNRASVTPTLIQGSAQTMVMSNPDYYVNNPRMKLLTPPDMWAVISGSLEHPERLMYYRQAISDRSFQERLHKVKQLWDAGVRVNIGTDTGTVLNLPTEAMWSEMYLFTKAGISPMEVIGTATRRNAEYIGMQDELGTITPGKLADIIIIDGNPLENMREMRYVVGVIKDGKVIKGAGAETPAQRSTSRP